MGLDVTAAAILGVLFVIVAELSVILGVLVAILRRGRRGPTG